MFRAILDINLESYISIRDFCSKKIAPPDKSAILLVKLQLVHLKVDLPAKAIAPPFSKASFYRYRESVLFTSAPADKY